MEKTTHHHHHYHNNRRINKTQLVPFESFYIEPIDEYDKRMDELIHESNKILDDYFDL